MSKNFVSIKPSGGVSRLRNAELNRPYHLENAQMELQGFVRSVNKPSTLSVAETGESKPYVEWNGAMLDRDSFSARAGAQVAAEAISDATLNARLYRSVKGTDSEGNDSYRVVKFYSDWDFNVGSNQNWQGEPAIVHTANVTAKDWNDFDVVGSTSTTTIGDVDIRSHVGYIAIPYDKNGEAGNWLHFTAERAIERVYSGAGQTGVSINLARMVEVQLLGGSSMERVEIFRTMDMNDRGFVSTGPIDITDVAEGDGQITHRFLTDQGYYFFGEFHASSNNVTNQRQVDFRDDNFWTTAIIIELIKNEVSWPITDATDIVWEFPFTNLEGAYNRIKTPTELIQRGRNHHSIHTDPTEAYQYHGPSAEVMAAQSDVIMYGNVRLPTKRPTTGLVLHREQVPFATIEAQLEYVDNNGHVYYGPKDSFAAAESLLFAWQGESALLIFRGGTLFERLTPNEFGMYVTGYIRQDSDDEGFAPQVSYIANADNSSVTFLEDPNATLVDYYTESNAIFLSASERGMEVTFDSFFVKASETVRAIVPARLAEDESIRDYDFYVMTDRSITLYKRTGDSLRTVVPVHNVTNKLGVKENTFTALSGTNATTHTLATSTRFGVAFIGTDDRVYHLVGRQLTQLDLEIPGLFDSHGGYRDIEYHANCDEIWVLFNNAVIWVYDFVQQGWTRNHSLTNVHFNLYYRESTGNLHSWGTVLGLSSTFAFDEDATNIHTLSQYATQPLGDGGGDTQVAEMQVDYAFDSYAELNKVNWARMRHSVRSPKIATILESYDPANGRRLVEYDIPANRSFFPTLAGRGHQFRFDEFQELRDIEIKMVKTNQ